MKAGEGHNVSDITRVPDSVNDWALSRMPSWVRDAFNRSQRPWHPSEVLEICERYNIAVHEIPAIVAYEDAVHAIESGRGHLHTFCEVMQKAMTLDMLPRESVAIENGKPVIIRESHDDWALRIGFSIRQCRNDRSLPPRRASRKRPSRDIKFAPFRLRHQRRSR